MLAREEQQDSHVLLVGMKTGVTVLEDKWAASHKTTQTWQYCLAIETPGIHPVELKTALHIGICSWIYHCNC